MRRTRRRWKRIKRRSEEGKKEICNDIRRKRKTRIGQKEGVEGKVTKEMSREGEKGRKTEIREDDGRGEGRRGKKRHEERKRKEKKESCKRKMRKQGKERRKDTRK